MAGEVRAWEPTRWIAKKKLKEMDRFMEFAVAASTMAIEDAKLELLDSERRRAGCFVGNGVGGLFSLEKTKETLLTKRPMKLNPYAIPTTLRNLSCGHA